MFKILTLCYAVFSKSEEFRSNPVCSLHSSTIRKLQRQGALKRKDLKTKDGTTYFTVFLVEKNKPFLKSYKKKQKISNLYTYDFDCFQVIFLLLQFLVLGNRSSSPKSVASEDLSILPFLFFFVFIPSILLSKKNNLSEKKRAWLAWGLVILAVIVSSLMIVVLVKAW